MILGLSHGHRRGHFAGVLVRDPFGHDISTSSLTSMWWTLIFTSLPKFLDFNNSFLLTTKLGPILKRNILRGHLGFRSGVFGRSTWVLQESRRALDPLQTRVHVSLSPRGVEGLREPGAGIFRKLSRRVRPTGPTFDGRPGGGLVGESKGWV